MRHGSSIKDLKVIKVKFDILDLILIPPLKSAGTRDMRDNPNPLPTPAKSIRCQTPHVGRTNPMAYRSLTRGPFLRPLPLMARRQQGPRFEKEEL